MNTENFPTGKDGSEANEIRTSGPVIGRILHERFLVERDLTDHSLGGGFLVFFVKDLKNYCREAILKLTRFVNDDSGADGPSILGISHALERLGHRNIEEFLESGRFANGRPFMLTKPYRATSLDRLIKNGKRLELEEIADLVEQIADGLAAAHGKRILHCDLRPSNILVPAGDIGAGNVKIANFGSAWPIDVRGESLENLEPNSESLHYAAPELLVKLGHRSPASDIYSLSVLVYRLLTGSVPFLAADRAGMLEIINAGDLARPTESRTDISRQAADLVLAGLSFEPAYRPQKIDDFALLLIRSFRPPRGIPVPPISDASEVDPGVRLDEAEQIPVEEPPLALLANEKIRQTFTANQIDQGTTVPDRIVAWALIILLMAGALSIPIGQTLLNKGTEAAAIDTIAGRPVETSRRHELRYWFEPNGKKGVPYRNNFAGGGTPGLSFASNSPGFAYVFYEFIGEEGRPDYVLGFPAPESAEAWKGIEVNKAVRSMLPREISAKSVWIIWTAGKNSDLESIRGSVKDGAVTNEDDRRRLRHFLERNRNVRLEVKNDDHSGQTVLGSSDDKIVHRIELGEGR